MFMEACAAAKNLTVAVSPDLVRVPSQRLHYPNVTSVTSNDKGDKEMIPRSVHRSPSIISDLKKTPET